MPAAPKDKTPKKPERKTVQVRATKLGFYGHMLRPAGTVFNIRIAAGEKFPSWCEELGAGAEAADETKSDASDESKGSSSDDVI
jgi:hypothetical protein